MVNPPVSTRGAATAPVAARSLTRRMLATALCLAAMLLWAVVAPGAAALANGPEHAGSQGPPDHAGERGAPDHASKESDAPRSDAQAQQRSDEQAPRSERGEEAPRSERADEVRGGQQGERQRSERAGATGGPSDSPAEAAEQDPNRGSIKVRSTGEETWPPRNEPHLDACEFWIHLHGFDEDERDVRIYAWAPTGDKQLVHAGSVSLEQARGNDYSGIYPTSAESGLTLDDLDADASWPAEYEPHDQQGWHLRVEVEGPKHKMFWLDCPVDEPDVAPEAEPAEEPEVEPTEQPEEQPAVEDIQLVVGDEQEQLGVGGAQADDEVAVLGLLLEDGDAFGIGGAEPAADVQVAGVVRQAEADVLPVTGGSLVWLAAIGLLFSVVGTRMVAASRPTGVTR